MRLRRARVSLAACVLGLASALPASAGINITGRWRVTYTADFAPPFVEDIDIFQNGSTLTTSNTWPGTIDSASGAIVFIIRQSCPLSPFEPAPEPFDTQAPATASTDGNSLTGSRVFLERGGPTHPCVPLTAYFTGERIRRFVCGNHVLDPGEQCDGGPCCTIFCQRAPAGTVCGAAEPESCFERTCTAAGLCTLDATSQPDGDADGIADRCDPCTGGSVVVPSRLQLNASGVVTVRGNMPLTIGLGGLDPVATGARIRLVDANDLVLLDATASAGAWTKAAGTGWKVRKKGRGWVYTGRGPLDRVVLDPSRAPGSLAVQLRGTRPSGVATGPFRLLIALEPPGSAGGACAEQTYPVALCKTSAQRLVCAFSR